MGNLDDITAIRAYFLEAFTEAPVIVRGVDEEDDQSENAYVALSIVPSIKEDRLTLGAVPEYERKGLVWVDVYSPHEDRDGAAWALADAVADTLRDWRSPDARIRCDNVSMRRGTDEDKFIRIIINLDYRARH